MIGAPHRHFARTDSTNTRARELAAAGAPHGAVVTAAEQTSGRGRQGRQWTAPPGGALLYSALLREIGEGSMLLPLAAPLAVCDAAEELAAGTSCGVKWPNDVLVDGRKLSGVLIEARPHDGWAVIGIGLNLFISREEFPPDLRDRAVSLFSPEAQAPGMTRRSLPAVAPPAHSRSLLHTAETLSRHLDAWVGADPEQVLAAWRERDVLRGREVAWEGGSGVADGIDDRGYLLVLTAAGERIAVGAGEVHLTRS